MNIFEISLGTRERNNFYCANMHVLHIVGAIFYSLFSRTPGNNPEMWGILALYPLDKRGS